MKNIRLRTIADLRLLREKFLPNIGRALLLVVLGALLLFAWQKATRSGETGDYEGRVVDRWADYIESNQGSRPRFRLLVESTGWQAIPGEGRANSLRIGASGNAR